MIVNIWESLRFLAVLSSLAHKCTLKWTYSDEEQHPNSDYLGKQGNTHNSIWTCQQKELHLMLKPIDLPGAEHRQNSPVPADWAPKEPNSTLAWILHSKESQTCQAHGWPQALWCLLLCFWPTVNSPCWQRVTLPPSCTFWQQQEDAAEHCPVLSPLSSFPLAQLGTLAFSKCMNPTEKLVKTVGAFGRP